MKNQKGFVNVILIGSIVVLVAIGGYFLFLKQTCVPERPNSDLYVCGNKFSNFLRSLRKPVSVDPTQVPNVAKDKTKNSSY